MNPVENLMVNRMTVKEVIKQLESLKDNSRSFITKDCDNDIWEADIVALDMAIEALQKQEPQIPTYQGDGYADGHMVYDTWECPGCGKHYDVDGIYKNWKYCPECGQKIDWREQEKSE